MEEACMTIQHANKEYICPLGIVRNVKVLVGMIKYHAYLLYLVVLKTHFVVLSQNNQT